MKFLYFFSFRIDEFIRLQIKPKILNYKIPFEFFYSFSNFRKLKFIKNQQIFNRFYNDEKYSYGIKHRNLSKLIDGKFKKNSDFEKIKKKYKLHYYSNSRFEEKFGESIFRFIGDLNSLDNNNDNDNEKFKEKLEKIDSAPTKGRRVVYFNKKLLSKY